MRRTNVHYHVRSLATVPEYNGSSLNLGSKAMSTAEKPNVTEVFSFKCDQTGLIIVYVLQDEMIWNVVAFGDYSVVYKQLLKRSEAFEFGFWTYRKNICDGVEWLRMAKISINNALPISAVSILSDVFSLNCSHSRFITSPNVSSPKSDGSLLSLDDRFTLLSVEHRKFAVAHCSASPFAFKTIPHSGVTLVNLRSLTANNTITKTLCQEAI